MDLQTMMSDIRYLVFGDSSNTQYADTDIKRNINKAYRYWIAKAIKYTGWQIRGTYATINTLSSKNKYSLSTEILRFNQVLLKNSATSDYVVVKPVDIDFLDTPLDEYSPVNPEYDLRYGYITIYWSETIAAVNSGLKLYVQKDITALSGATDLPDFPEPFIDLINLEAAKRYCIPYEMRAKLKDINEEILIKQNDFDEYMSGRNGLKPILKPIMHSYR
jgi:hypothetical protein